jgi:hypothetical protein
LPKARYGGRHGSPYWWLRHCHPPLRLRPSAATSAPHWHPMTRARSGPWGPSTHALAFQCQPPLRGCGGQLPLSWPSYGVMRAASWVVGAVALWSLVGRREYAWPRLARPSRGAASSCNLHDKVMRQHCTAIIGLRRLQGCILEVPDPALDPHSCVSRLRHHRACGRCNWSSFRGFVTSCGTMPYPVVYFIGRMGGWVSL